MHQLKNEIYHYFERIFEAPWWKGAFSIVTAICVTLFGEFDQYAKYFLLAFAFDVISGGVKGIITHNFKSRYLRKSATKAISYGSAIILAHFGEMLGIVGFRVFIISILGITELISIGENLKETKAKLPDFMMDELERYKEKLKRFKMK